MAVIFSKSLTDTDVKHRFAVPTEHFEHLGKIPEGHHKTNFTALDLEGKPWLFRLSTRTKGQYSKPVISGKGWVQFVEVRCLKEGDVITFSKETDEANGVTLRIKVQKKIRLMGANITKDV